MAARRLASRIAAVREAVGLAAYHAGEWQTAIAELRTYHRMTGLQIHLAVLADCERALGRPERAIDLFRGADREKLDRAVAIELLIVAAGARGDLGQKDAAVAMLQVRELTAESTEPWAARLRYAYADALLAVGRREEAREWFSRAADIDSEGETDAAERLLELDGVLIEGDDEDDEPEGDGTASAPAAGTDADDLDEDDDRDDEDDDDLDDEDEDDDLDDEDDDLEDEDDDLEDEDDDDLEDEGDDERDDARSVRAGDDRADTADAGDAARAGYRDRDAGDLADDALTDAEAGALAAADAPVEADRDRPATEDTRADDARVDDVRAGGDEAAERR
ncbi:Replicase polyprotein 1ab [Micromonospora robiginosa]|uniref:Replicase polyprotein 1ab n=1 Tax=Micromonospora robiginosa TaxID=2749844 RepID=A0AAF0T0E8_9ACTN|nr:Replicase polyprotein 1ab [Micromonospora ferruginea]WMF04542.1 Replicase polyprotein 1ab [Micromonospora ferruginea]